MQFKTHFDIRYEFQTIDRKKKSMPAKRFELLRANTMQLECTALDHSAKPAAPITT